MNILAIDTSSEYLSLALQSNSKESHILEKIGSRHTEFILDKIHEILTLHNLVVNDINLIAYNQGPGSFTGLRIGISAAIGIALGLDIKLVAIPSFAIHAIAIKNKYNLSGRVLVGLDARLNQLYIAGINLNDFTYFIDPAVANPNEIEYTQDTIYIGNGFITYLDSLNPKVQDNIKSSEFSSNDYPNALGMLELVNMRTYPELDVDNADLLYLRNKVAMSLEEQKLFRQKTGG
jgi:tRNA threonylcarbamoyladenosine biosynthesis protein TsaB